MKRLLAVLMLSCPVGAFAQAGCSSGPNGCGQLNVSAFLQATVASATTVPLNTFTVITGTTPIATFTPPPTFSAAVGGCYDFLSVSANATTTAGNIFAVYSLTANTNYRACYFTVAGVSKWYVK